MSRGDGEKKRADVAVPTSVIVGDANMNSRSTTSKFINFSMGRTY
jgi:hypothetical protein